jgi:Carboxypeptidase regulatory-like domain
MARRTLSIGWIRVLFVILLFVSVGAAADPTGTISGLVTDPSGAVIPGATVTVKHASTGLTRSTVTDAQGAFLFPLMPVGGYGLTVEASGFRRFEQSGITLVLNSVANLPVIMQLGSLNESINVQADAAMVETRSGTLQGVVDQQRIVDLPLNGRNAANLVLLVAGTTDLMAGNSRGSGDAIQGGTYPGGQAVSASGARSDGVNYLLDGGSNRDPYTNVNDPFPNPDALQEFVVQTNNYSAEQGRASGAVVSVVTKSGTNQIHGSAFEFLRNNALNARNFFFPRIGHPEAQPVRRQHRGAGRKGQALLLRNSPGDDSPGTACFAKRRSAHGRNAQRRFFGDLARAERSGDRPALPGQPDSDQHVRRTDGKDAQGHSGS